jgi:hypothetical protein
MHRSDWPLYLKKKSTELPYFIGGICDCQILNEAVELRRFTSSWNRFQIRANSFVASSWFRFPRSASPASESRINPCFTAGKKIGVGNCHGVMTSEKDHLHIHSMLYLLRREGYINAFRLWNREVYVKWVNNGNFVLRKKPGNAKRNTNVTSP